MCSEANRWIGGQEKFGQVFNGQNKLILVESETGNARRSGVTEWSIELE
jgi:hypothetical protein